MKPSRGSTSLRRYLLVGILLPVVALISLNAISLYQEALYAANTAYDRTLLASAKTISEQLDVVGHGDEAQLSVRVPYAALEAFEADNQSQMFYRVSAPSGATISGYEDLAPWTGKIPLRTAYAALVDFYDDVYREQPVRVAALVQPVSSAKGSGLAIVQVAETLDLREALAREVLIDTLWRQGLLVLMIGVLVVWVVHRATQPVRDVSTQLHKRPENDLTPIEVDNAPKELAPLIGATNQLMARLAQLLEHQRRFVRDTSHQLRTPLAVLKAQVQSARRGDLPAQEALQDIEATVNRATRMANQMLALAKIEQLREQAQTTQTRWDECVRNMALELAPLVAEREIDFDIETTAVTVLAHEWMLNEMARNLLHNAIQHTAAHAQMRVKLWRPLPNQAVLEVHNQCQGLSETQKALLFRPFAQSGGQLGSGLGLAICHAIVQALGGRIEMHNTHDGVLASVWLELPPSGQTCFA